MNSQVHIAFEHRYKSFHISFSLIIVPDSLYTFEAKADSCYFNKIKKERKNRRYES